MVNCDRIICYFFSVKSTKILLILLVVFSFVLLACRDDLGTFDGSEVYSDPTIGFEITPPEGWYESGVMADGRFVTFVDSEGDVEDGIDAFHSYLSVASDSAGDLSFSEYMERAKENAKDAVDGLEYLEEESVQINGHSGEIVVTQLEEGEVEVVKMQLLVMRNTSVYIVTGTSLASAWDENEQTIQDALLSFSFD